jgi:hypothetical protein
VENGRVGTKGVEESFTQGMHPRYRRGSAEELEQVCLRKWGRHLSPEGGSFLGDAVKLAPKASHLIERAWPRGVNIHGAKLGEAVILGVVSPAANKFPCPQNFKGLVTGDAKGVGDGGGDGFGIEASSRPAGGETGDVPRQLGRGDAGAPDLICAREEGVQGSSGFRARHGAGAFSRGFIGCTTG